MYTNVRVVTTIICTALVMRTLCVVPDGKLIAIGTGSQGGNELDFF